MKRFGLLAVLLASGAVAFTQDGPKPDELFKRLDKNNDGKVVKDEVPEDQVRFFERLVRLGDDDKNGELTLAEFTKASSEEPRRPEGGGPGPEGRGPGPGFDAKQIFDRMDRNSDGKVTRDELPEFARERFGRLFDELKKDSMTYEDFQKMRERLGPPPGAGGAPGQPGQGGPGRGFGDPEENFKRLDTNGDGKFTRGEIPEQGRRFLEPMFDRLGKDEITKADFVRLAEQFRGQREGGGTPAGGRPEGGRPDGERRPEGGMRDGERRPMPRFFQLLDKDNNGKLSKSELERVGSLMAELDRNNDGELDQAELLGPPPGAGPGPGREGDRPRPDGERPRPEGEGRDRPRPDGERPAAGRPEGDRPMPRPEGNRPEGDGQRRDELFNRMDKNGDGKLSKDEAPDRLRENFDRVDKNKDGFVDRAELRELFERGEGERPKREGEGDRPKRD